MESPNTILKEMGRLKAEMVEIALPIALEVVELERIHSKEVVGRMVALGPEDKGLCNDKDPDFCFPGAAEYAQGLEARKLCAQCPLMRACIRQAFFTDTSASAGIRGGLPAAERMKLMRRARKALA